jgi:hypothetical protein
MGPLHFKANQIKAKAIVFSGQFNPERLFALIGLRGSAAGPARMAGEIAAEDARGLAQGSGLPGSTILAIRFNGSGSPTILAIRRGVSCVSGPGARSGPAEED